MKNQRLALPLALSFLAHIFMFSTLALYGGDTVRKKSVPVKVTILPVAKKGDFTPGKKTSHPVKKTFSGEMKRFPKKVSVRESIPVSPMAKSGEPEEGKKMPEPILLSAKPETIDGNPLRKADASDSFGEKQHDTSSHDIDYQTDFSGATPAAVLVAHRPEYPRRSRVHSEEGTVVLQVEVLAGGELGAVEIVESSGFSRLDKAALKAVNTAKFVPATRGGIKVSSIKKIAFTFRLEEAE